MELTRREALKLGLLGSAALLLPLEQGARTASSIRNRLRTSELPKPFRAPLTIPSVAKPVRSDATTDYYQIKMQMNRTQILPKKFGPTLIYGYDGITPGPTIEEHRGRQAVVRHINMLPARHPTLGDPKRSDADVPLGAVEIWDIETKSGGWFHPLHIHLIDFKILDRNGKPPFDHELGPKDVVYVGENERVRLIAKFGPRQGRYMIHCHNLVHEDHDMMTHFDVGPTGEDPAAKDLPKDLPAPPL